MIRKCSFGSMMIVDQTYDSDLIIFPDGRVSDHWWRPSGHRLALDDIQDLVAVAPEVIVAGTGIYGRMQLDSDVKTQLAEKGIELVAERTKKAAETYNRLKETTKKVGGCFHLTC